MNKEKVIGALVNIGLVAAASLVAYTTMRCAMIIENKISSMIKGKEKAATA